MSDQHEHCATCEEPMIWQTEMDFSVYQHESGRVWHAEVSTDYDDRGADLGFHTSVAEAIAVIEMYAAREMLEIDGAVAGTLGGYTKLSDIEAADHEHARRMHPAYDRHGSELSIDDHVALMRSQRDDPEGYEEYALVAHDEVGRMTVRTLWTGVDKSGRSGPPMIFSTVVFGGGPTVVQHRFPSVEEAEAGHARVVELLKELKKPIGTGVVS